MPNQIISSLKPKRQHGSFPPNNGRQGIGCQTNISGYQSMNLNVMLGVCGSIKSVPFKVNPYIFLDKIFIYCAKILHIIKFDVSPICVNILLKSDHKQKVNILEMDLVDG